MLQKTLTLIPGIFLSIGIAALALAASFAERFLFGAIWLESLVLAIILGTATTSLFGLAPRFRAGVEFCAKTVLEIAIVLLGAAISIEALGDAGLSLVGGIVAVVVISLVAGYAISRGLGLSTRLAILVACGNSICGNSAIAAAAPVIRAEAEEVAASLSFTAVLSIAVVLLLPALYAALDMSAVQSGVLAGLTVYAVPQVLAAAAPAGALGVQAGTLVKLVRVLMLGPVIFALGLMRGRNGETRTSLTHLVPWFIIGFVAMMALRSAGWIPAAALPVLHEAAGLLTLIAMAALGLTVDVRSVMHSSGRIILAACASLVVLCLVSLTLIHLLGVV